MLDLLTPPRRRGVEILDSPDIDPAIVTRSLADVARANALFGGISSAIDEIKDVLRTIAVFVWQERRQRTTWAIALTSRMLARN